MYEINSLHVETYYSEVILLYYNVCKLFCCNIIKSAPFLWPSRRCQHHLTPLAPPGLNLSINKPLLIQKVSSKSAQLFEFCTQQRIYDYLYFQLAETHTRSGASWFGVPTVPSWWLRTGMASSVFSISLRQIYSTFQL